MTMGTVVTEFQRGWDEVRQLGREEGRDFLTHVRKD